MAGFLWQWSQSLTDFVMLSSVWLVFAFMLKCTAYGMPEWKYAKTLKMHLARWGETVKKLDTLLSKNFTVAGSLQKHRGIGDARLSKNFTVVSG